MNLPEKFFKEKALIRNKANRWKKVQLLAKQNMVRRKNNIVV